MAKVQQISFLAVLKTSALSPCIPYTYTHTHTHTHTHKHTPIPTHSGTRGHYTLSLTLLFLAGSCGREGRKDGGVTGSLTSRALPAVIGVQELVEAAGYNWMAARTLCGWLSKPRSPLFTDHLNYSPGTRLCTTRPLTQQPQFLSKICECLYHGIVCVCVCVCVGGV